ncbi:MAG: glycosyltransferase family 2 protein [Candidatus Omnitrophica bacterium]|nr:glycosyltransferase family 2 protein [Candidatus Omnitrophota bacterium]
MGKIGLSVVILAKNEKDRISECIRSVSGWACEIIVVDDDSTDETRSIAESMEAKVFRKAMAIEGMHRNWAYAQAECEWVLSLDADERPTAELKAEIKAVLSANPPENAFTIPRRNFIGDYWIKGGGLYPAPQLKLFRKGKFRWEDVEVHPRAFLEGACGHLKNDLIHYTYRNWGDFLTKLNKQTTLEARKWYKLSADDPKKARYKMNIPHALWRTIDRFIRTFVFKKGYRDGFTGFMIAYFSSLYQIISFAKYRELEKNDRN